MKLVDYKDGRGRWYRVRLPDEVPVDQASLGVPVGPPNVVDDLGLPEPFATNLHNQLFMRKLYTAEDVRKNTQALQGAIMTAMAVDVSTVYESYTRLEVDSVLT